MRWTQLVAFALALIAALGLALPRLKRRNSGAPPLRPASRAPDSFDTRVEVAACPPDSFRDDASPTPPSIFSSVDEAIAKMPLGGIAFNSPSPINIDHSARVELVLDLHLPSAALAKLITARGVVEYAQVRISNRMSARLTGSDFDITANSLETQAISSNEPTIWLWTVKPKTVGEFNLCVNLDALVTVDGAPAHRTIRTFSQSILVTVTPAQRVTKFAKANWQWLSATILIPVVGWWWQHRH